MLRLIPYQVREWQVEGLGICVDTYGELLYGGCKSNQADKAKKLVHQRCDYIPPLTLSLKVPDYYAVIRADLEKQGRIIGNNDLWMCLTLSRILYHLNNQQCKRILLNIDNWVND